MKKVEQRIKKYKKKIQSLREIDDKEKALVDHGKKVLGLAQEKSHEHDV